MSTGEPQTMQTYLRVLCLLGAIAVSHSQAGCQKTKPGRNSKGGGQRKTTVAPSTDGSQKIIEASNKFSQHLYQQIAPGPNNVFYSPYSIHLALTMTSHGARGDTKTEMTSTLGLDVFTGEREPHEAYKEVIEQLNAAPDVTTIQTANAIFVNKNETIESAFVIDVQNYYLSDVFTFDPNDPAGPETVINVYVENKTRGLIKKLVPPNVITILTKMVIVNVVYFNGSWDRPFSRDETQLADFHTAQGTIQVNTMIDTRTMNIKRNFYGADVGEFPMGNGRFSLFVVLPHKVDGLAEQERNLIIPGRIKQMFEGLTPVRVNVSLPKVDITSRFQLSQPLRQLGMVKAFSAGQANFTGIDRNGGLYVGPVIHEAVLQVNEAGTIAAAATAVVIEIVSLPPPPTSSFYVKHPCLLFLRDNLQEMILFQGKVTAP